MCPVQSVSFQSKTRAQKSYDVVIFNGAQQGSIVLFLLIIQKRQETSWKVIKTNWKQQ